MPIISTFFGIVVRMYYKEHEPAHFHAEYQGQQAKFSFDGEVLIGNLSSRTRADSYKSGRFNTRANFKRIGKRWRQANNSSALHHWSDDNDLTASRDPRGVS